MAGDAKKLQPIIIKRIKKGGHAAHGGAWKIAYADFVTAMMAFFLLMWLLGSTTEGDRKGIQDYFANPVKISMLGGSGSGDSSSVVQGGGEDLSRQGGQVKRGETEHKRSSYTLAKLESLKAEQAEAEQARLKLLRDKVEEVLIASPRLTEFKSQIKLDLTRDGLRIQITDAQNRPMFTSGSATVQPYLRELLRTLGEVLGEVPNRLTLEGHTDAAPFTGGAAGYSNWELSADRANASRRELIAGGLDDGRILRVQGLAASQPFVKDDPLAPTNRRISIVVMNREAEDRFFRGAEREEPPIDVDNAQRPPEAGALIDRLPPPPPPSSPPATGR